MSHDDRPRDAAVQATNHLQADDLVGGGFADESEMDDPQAETPVLADASGKAKTKDTNNPRTRSPADQVKVWEEEGGSPPGQIAATVSVKPKRGSKAGSMGAAKD